MASNGDSSSGSSFFSTSDTVPLLINGEACHTKETFDVFSPTDGRKLYRSSTASTTDVAAAISAAEAALKPWSATKPIERRDLLVRAAAEFERRKDEFQHYCLTETGTSEMFFGFDFEDARQNLKDAAGLIQTVLGSLPVPAEKDQSAMMLLEPYGVILAIAPWNAPCVLGLRSFLAALAVGNTVVLKGSESCPGVYWLLTDVFYKVGLPAGVLNVIYARPQDAATITEALVASPAIKKVGFTGSTNTGAIIASLAGKYLKPTLMELGGKAPAIVCEDADLQNAAFQCALGSFLNAGQICMSTERIIVHEKVAEEFKRNLRAAAEQYFPSNTPLIAISAAAISKNRALVKDAVQKGAKVLYGDLDEALDTATHMRPVIVEEVQKSMDIYETESFGPTVSLITVTSDEEAIRIANDTDFGLSSAVFTNDLRRGFRIAKQIETGAVHINTMSVHDESALPHGGAKKSGYGRFGGVEGMREWYRTKCITWKD